MVSVHMLENDVISSVRKHYCALGLGWELESGLGLVEIRLVKRIFKQVH